MSADQFTVLLLTGLTNIASLAIASLGLAVIFGMMRVINLAHGEFIMFGAYVALAGTRAGLPLGLAVCLAALVGGLFGAIAERLIIRPLYGRLLDTMLATWGLSLVMSQTAVIFFGTVTTGVTTPFGNLTIGGFSVSQYSLFLIVVALVLMGLTYLIFTRTKYGLLAQAATQDPAMASALGVDSSRINMLTFALGAALAGVAGAVLSPVVSITPTLGQAFTARTFLTVVVAGPVVLSGTTVAAGVLGSVQTAFSYLFTPVVGTAALLIVSILALRIYRFGVSAGWGRRI